MLRITVELVPFGDEDNKRKIAEMVIANTGSDNGYYEGWTAPDDWSGEPAMFGSVTGYDRSQSVWELIRLMLKSIRVDKDHEPYKDEKSLSQRLRKRLFR